jgi:hypothetical protein
MVLLGETGLRRRPVCMDNAHERTRILLMPYDLIHRKIICFNDERIGFIRDLLIDEVDWKLRFLHATQKGLLGLDKRHFLIPTEAVRRVAGGLVRIDLSKEQGTRGA